jgi:multiple sugar transport system permease protein
VTTSILRAAASRLGPGQVGRQVKRLRRRRTQTLTAVVFLAPLIVLMCLFVLYPLVNTVRLSLFSYHFQTSTSHFVGMQNYIKWARDPEMWQGAWTSLKFFVYYVPASIIVSLAIAILIDRIANRKPWLAGLYRTIFYFPVMLPAAIVFNMWVDLFDPTYGVFAQVSSKLGLPVVNWLGSPHLALPGIALMSIWRLMGETIILLLVGLANIPREMNEAARIDGAGEWALFRRITLPMLKPMLFLVLVLRLKVLGLIVEPLFMTKGGPADSTMTYGLRAYYDFFQRDNVGYASAWFVMLAVLSVVIAVIAGRRMRSS